MSEHDAACTCDRCQMMVMPTSRTASERVLTDKIRMRPYGDDGWAFSDDGCGCGAGGLAVMQTGGEPFAVEQHIAGCGDDDLPARVIVALAARVAELEAENAKHRSTQAAIYRALGTANPNRDDWPKEIGDIRQENAKLRKCVKAGDAFRIKVQAAENYCVVSGIYSLAALHGIRYEGPVWKGELEDYLAARAEVDK